MKNLKNWLTLTSVAIGAGMGLFASQVAFADSTPAPSSTPPYTCAAPSAWFTAKSIPRPNPADPVFSASNNTKCDFHLFSWQAFMWLTEADKAGKLRFEGLYSDSAIDPRARAPHQHILGGVQQANSLGILVDQNGRAVYTSILIDEIYRHFVIKNKLYTSAGLQNVNPNLTFPVGALSLKAAWRIVQPGEDVSRFFTTKAKIQLLATVDGVVTTPKKPKIVDATVALVGFHIAEIVHGHPEAVWATFEQVDNAPDFKPGQTMNEVVSDKSFTFYKGGTPASGCNINNAPVITLDAATQKLTPITQACRQFRDGGGNAENMGNIDTLNQSMHSQLPANSMWQNYIEVGAVWFNTANALTPNWNPNTNSSLITGSNLLSSAVIETFTQNAVSTNQCFSCHNTMPIVNTENIKQALPGKDVSTSHVLLQKYLSGHPVKR
jgi:hypothetical protein